MNLEWIDFKLCDSVLISVPFCFILIHFPCSCGAEKISVTHPLPPSSVFVVLLMGPFATYGGGRIFSSTFEIDFGILLPSCDVFKLSVWDFYVRISLAWHSSTIAVKRWLAICPSDLHCLFHMLVCFGFRFIWGLFAWVLR